MYQELGELTVIARAKQRVKVFEINGEIHHTHRLESIIKTSNDSPQMIHMFNKILIKIPGILFGRFKQEYSQIYVARQRNMNR